MAEEPPLAIGLREDGRTATGGSKIDTAYGLDAAGGYTIGFHGRGANNRIAVEYGGVCAIIQPLCGCVLFVITIPMVWAIAHTIGCVYIQPPVAVVGEEKSDPLRGGEAGEGV